MAEEPERLYGDAIGSSYQGQMDTLSKHFKPAETDEPDISPAGGAHPPGNPRLFDDGPS
jgi:hypothetical protein